MGTASRKGTTRAQERRKFWRRGAFAAVAVPSFTRSKIAPHLILPVVLVMIASYASGQIAVRNQGYMPFTDEPINYRSRPVADPVAKLQQRLDKGQTQLEYEPRFGYLKSLLEQLDVPVSSQTLVFSKTSFQYKKISPQTPRALYYNDDVYVGYVHDGKALEIISFDPVQGAIFYLLDVQKQIHPVFQRAELDCSQCHIAPATRNIPGVLLRSIYTTPQGTVAARSTAAVVGQETPLKDRWGGWYVTGTHGSSTHMGNTALPDGQSPEQFDRSAGANLVKLDGKFDNSLYLSGHSDIVAHLVLAHQTQMHNLITITNYQTRLALYDDAKSNKASVLAEGTVSDAATQKIQKPAEDLLRYLLFTNEIGLNNPIKGTSGFTEQFAAEGPRDSRGRSLRDFDLQTRIFRYPCSYLIYSDDFDAIPQPAKDYIYRRLVDVLTGHDQTSDFASLTQKDRLAILDILKDTKPDFAVAWNKYAGPVTRTNNQQTNLANELQKGK